MKKHTNLLTKIFGLVALGLLAIGIVVVLIGTIVAATGLGETLAYPHIVITIILNTLLPLGILLCTAFTIFRLIKKQSFNIFIVISLLSVFVYDCLLRLNFGTMALINNLNYWAADMFIPNFIVAYVTLFGAMLGILLIILKKPITIITGKIVLIVATLVFAVYFGVVFQSTMPLMLNSDIVNVGFAIVTLGQIIAAPFVLLMPIDAKKESTDNQPINEEN